MTQYTTTYANPPTDILNIVSNKCGVMDKYIVMQTGQYEYQACVYSPVTKKGTVYTFSRGTTSYNSHYTVSKVEVTTMDYSVYNECYVYSNVGYGKSLDLPVMQNLTTYALMTICCVLLFAVVFKGALFRCLDRK